MKLKRAMRLGATEQIAQAIKDGLLIPIPCKKIVLHVKPDLDAIAAYWLARSFPQAFPGIEEAPVEFWPAGSPPPDERTSEEHEAEGTICFDVAEGRFDHHPHGKCLNKCATDLVADHLGVSTERALEQILGFIRMHDLEGPVALTLALRKLGIKESIVEMADLLQSFSLYSVIDSLRSRHHGKELSLINEVCTILDHEYRQQVFFWTIVRGEFESKAEIRAVDIGRRIYKVALIESPIHGVGSFSRTREGGFCAVCIHRDPKTGHTFISGHLQSEQFLEIGKVLRVWDLTKAGLVPDLTQEILEESKFKPQQVWYMPLNIRGEVYIVMNGGEKATSTTPSALTLDEIFSAIYLGLDNDMLSETCPMTSCLLDQCPYYPFFLARCKAIREQEPTA